MPEKIVSNDVWYARREGAGESSVIHVHDKTTGTIAFRMTQSDARALFNVLSQVTLMPPEKQKGSNAKK
jgi:hypothetical protein